MKIYVASPYATAKEVRELHARLKELGHEPTSRWAEVAAQHDDKEDFSLFTPDDLQRIARDNDCDLYEAESVVVWSRPVGGRETYAEAARAQVAGKIVYWVGTKSLSAFRPRTTYLPTIDDFLYFLRSLATMEQREFAS